MADIRRLGGWTRAFIVLGVTAGVATSIFWVDQYPDSIESGRRIYECDEFLVDPYKTIDLRLANQLIAAQSFRDLASTECLSSLTKMVDGRMEKEERQRWRDGLGTALLGVAVLLAALYAAGWSAGWVWRGFFPKSS